jgi:cystathionine beta-lyase/cystathionine gamma-synthase
MVTQAAVLTAPKKLASPCFTITLVRGSFVALFLKHVALFENCTSLGGAASSVDHRAQWGSAQEADLRLSIGLEDVQDLIADLDRTFRVIRSHDQSDSKSI